MDGGEWSVRDFKRKSCLYALLVFGGLCFVGRGHLDEGSKGLQGKIEDDPDASNTRSITRKLESADIRYGLEINGSKVRGKVCYVNDLSNLVFDYKIDDSKGMFDHVELSVDDIAVNDIFTKVKDNIIGNGGYSDLTGRDLDKAKYEVEFTVVYKTGQKSTLTFFVKKKPKRSNKGYKKRK